MSYYNKEDEQVIEPPEEIKLQHRIKELTGFDDSATDEQGKPIPLIDPESLTPETRAEVDAILGQLEEYAKGRDYESLAKTINDALIPDPTPEDIKAARTALKFAPAEKPIPKAEPLPSSEELTKWKREWLVPGWLPSNTVTLFNGHGGIGKSHMVLQHVAAISQGLAKCYFNTEMKTNNAPTLAAGPQNIIVVTWEDEPEEIASRFKKIEDSFAWADYDTIRENVHIVDMRGFGPIWAPAQEGSGHENTRCAPTDAWPILQGICNDNDASLLVLDPLSGAYTGNENARGMVYEFVSALRKWGEDTQTTTLMIGHFPKSTAQGKYSGSTAWPASVRSMWALDTNTGTVQKTTTDKKKGKDNEGNPEAKEYYSLTHEKANYSPSQAEVFLKKEENGLWTEVGTTKEATQAYQDYQAYLKSQKSNDTDYAEYGVNQTNKPEAKNDSPSYL